MSKELHTRLVEVRAFHPPTKWLDLIDDDERRTQHEYTWLW